MPHRIPAGSDIAMIGAWDASASANPFTKADTTLRQYGRSLDRDATAGQLFFVRTGADGDYPTDVYLDEFLPDGLLSASYPLAADREFLLHLPTGRLVIGGVEAYRSPKADSSPVHPLTVTPGDYSLTCRALPPPDERQAERDLASAVGPEDLAHHARINRRRAALGCLLPVALMIALLYPIGRWLDVPHRSTRALVSRTLLLSLCIALPTSIAYHRLSARRLRRDDRYQRVRQAIAAYDAAHANDPALIFHLRRITDGATHPATGGSADLTEPPP
jgi:hypothetical protein